jgi:cold shock CspA family protein
MRLSGTLRSWNDDRAFGFIAPTHGGAELFVHISALPRDGSRPTIGEKLTYEPGRGKNGKPQATNVQRSAIGPWRARSAPVPHQHIRSSPFVPRLIALVVLVALGAYGFNQYQKRAILYKQVAEPLVSQPSTSAPPGFTCDGRTHCSQMTSCREAKLFLDNCPGTEMDGNNDGVPCEQQWCKSSLAR